MSKENMKEVKSVVFLGDSGFPVGLAHIQRMTLMGRALIEAGCEVRVVCRLGVWRKNVKTDYGKEGIHEGIYYRYTVDSPFRQEGFITRQYQRVKGLINEFFYLIKLKKEGNIDAAVLSTMNFNDALRYKVYSIFLDFPIALSLLEMASALDRRSSFSMQVQNWLMENWLLKRFEGAMPISNKLCEFYTDIAPEKGNMKVPVICDYDTFSAVERNASEPYFLYCASISFMDVVEFVLDAYENMRNKDKVKLYLLIGVREQWQLVQLQEKLNTRFPEGNVELFSNVPYRQLMQLFTDAQALLIPLRHTAEDTARFPHKIGEYLATGNPVITTNVGEISAYFEDEVTALISQNYDVKEFAQKMDYVSNNTEQARKVGLKGKELGEKNFHFKAYGQKMKQFLQDLK